MTLPDLFTAIAATASVGFVSFIWWRIKMNLNRFETNLEKMDIKYEASMEKMDKAVNDKLYNLDGTPIYMHRHECDRMQGACRLMVCGKIDKLEKTMSKMDSKREMARDEFLEQMRNIAAFMARVEEHLLKE